MRGLPKRARCSIVKVSYTTKPPGRIADAIKGINGRCRKLKHVITSNESGTSAGSASISICRVATRTPLCSPSDRHRSSASAYRSHASTVRPASAMAAASRPDPHARSRARRLSRSPHAARIAGRATSVSNRCGRQSRFELGPVNVQWRSIQSGPATVETCSRPRARKRDAAQRARTRQASTISIGTCGDGNSWVRATRVSSGMLTASGWCAASNSAAGRTSSIAIR